MLTKLDAYDYAMEYLSRRPEEIYKTWGRCLDYPAGILFRFAKPDGDHTETSGCITMIHFMSNERYVVPERPDLTLAIQRDDRIPRPSDITPENLYMFAEWQRRLDKELDRRPPTWTGPPLEACEIDTIRPPA